jgi:hypothetical protein
MNRRDIQEKIAAIMRELERLEKRGAPHRDITEWPYACTRNTARLRRPALMIYKIMKATRRKKNHRPRSAGTDPMIFA